MHYVYSMLIACGKVQLIHLIHPTALILFHPQKAKTRNCIDIRSMAM